jgi:hypothetical protein
MKKKTDTKNVLMQAKEATRNKMMFEVLKEMSMKMFVFLNDAPRIVVGVNQCCTT